MSHEGRRAYFPPRKMLETLVEEEWLLHAFVGSLPRAALMWAWDQFALQGWDIAAELAADCLYLMRREVRRLDHTTAGATELRGAMRSTLRMPDVCSLSQLQAMLAPVSARTRARSGSRWGGRSAAGDDEDAARASRVPHGCVGFE